MNPPGFVGIDPTGLIGLADTADQYGQRVSLVRDNASSIADKHSFLDAAFIRCGLGAVAVDLANSASDLRWRAQVISRAQLICRVGPGPFAAGAWIAEFAATAVFEHGHWLEVFVTWRNEVLLERLSVMSPQEVARVLGEMDSSKAVALARGYPELIGPLDGAPPELRYLANDILIMQEIDRLRGIAAKVEGSGATLPSSELLGRRAELQIAEFQRWLDEDRQILLFDPTGDGRVAEVFGDLGSAHRVGIVVPGMANDIDNFSTVDGGFRADAEALHDSAASHDVATIAWLGYDTPDGLDAASRDSAVRAAPRLTTFLHGIDPTATRSVTVVAHSYGSVVAGIAAQEGVAVDDLVFVGSPGTTLSSADAAQLRTGGRVWAALAAGDPIGVGVDPFDSFRWWHGLHPLLPVIAMCRTLTARDELWHGTNPVSDEFGAIRIGTAGSHGHTSYFEETTLDNLALILAGRYSEVGLEGS